MKFGKYREGFTLVEIMAVLALIALLASLSVSVTLGLSKRSQVAKARADLELLSVALEAYRRDLGDYPQTADAEQLLDSLAGRLHPTGQVLNPVHRPWLELGSLELDETGAYLVDPWGNAYQYEYPPNMTEAGPGFVLYSLGPDGLGGVGNESENEDNIHASQD